MPTNRTRMRRGRPRADLLSLLLFALCVLSLAADTYNPFIYFRF